MSDFRHCTRCEDDGYVEQWTDDDHVLTYDCPNLKQPWHRPFNYTGILDPMTTTVEENRDA